MKRALLILGSIVVLIAAAAIAFIVFFPKDLVIAELKKQVQVSTGRTLTIAGATSMTFWPALGISAGDVQLSNPAGFDATPFLSAKKIVFAVSAAPLLKGDIEVKRLILDAPVLTLVARKEGEPNWTFPTAAAQTDESAKLKALRIEDMRITDGKLVYMDDGGAPPLEISDIDATVALDALDKPATLNGSCVYRTQKVTLAAVIGTPRALLEQGASPLTFKLDAPPLKATLDGAVNTATGAVTGKLETSGASVRKLLAWIGSPLPAGPNFAGFEVKGDMMALMPDVAFSKGVYRMDAIGATGDVKIHIAENGRLAVSGALAIPTLDVNPYMPAPTQGAASAAQGGVNTAAAWDATPLDLAGLRAADTDLALTVGGLRFQKMQFTNGALKLRLNNGVMDANLSRVSMYSGAGTAHLIVDASGGGAKIRSDIDVAGVQALPLLTAAIGFDKIEGSGRLKASLAGQGRSQAEIMRTLGGTMTFAFNDGAWRGVNLAQIARTVQAALTGASTGAAAKTDFAEFAADFTVAGGVANTQNLRLLNPFVRLDGKGALGIGAQDIDIRIAPRAVRSIQGQGGDATAGGIGVPFRVTGPWSKPRYGVDGESIAQTQVTRALGGRTAGEALGDLIGGKKKDGETTNPLTRLIPRK